MDVVKDTLEKRGGNVIIPAFAVGRTQELLYCFKSLTKPTFRPTFEISVKAGTAYTVKCDARDGKASVFVSQETRML